MTARLPSQLPDEAVFVDGANDWVLIQPSGKSKLYKIRPLAAVPDLPASKITSGTLNLARLPGIVTLVGSDSTGSPASLSNSFAAQLTVTTTGITASTRVLILASLTGTGTRASGSTGQYGAEIRLRRGSSTVLGNSVFPCYAADGTTTTAQTNGGTATLFYSEIITSNQTYYLDAQYVKGTGTFSGTRSRATLYIFALR